MSDSESTGRCATGRLAFVVAAGLFALTMSSFLYAMEEAGAAGRAQVVIEIRAAGHEPDWTFRLDPEGRMTFAAERVNLLVLMSAPAAGGTGNPGGLVYGTQSDADQLIAEVASGSCTDDKSGERFTHRVTIRYRGSEYRGCGTLLEVPLR
jgi:uncharacterized membrane protein